MYFSPLTGEEKIDIWKKKEKKQSTKDNQTNSTNLQKLNFDSIKKIELNQDIEIVNGSFNEDTKEKKVFGIYDPADNDFNLNMWSSTKAVDIKSSLKRIEKIKLSRTANQILKKFYYHLPTPQKE